MFLPNCLLFIALNAVQLSRPGAHSACLTAFADGPATNSAHPAGNFSHPTAFPDRPATFPDRPAAFPARPASFSVFPAAWGICISLILCKVFL